MVSIGGAGTFAVPVLLPPLLAADVALVLAFRQAPRLPRREDLGELIQSVERCIEGANIDTEFHAP